MAMTHDELLLLIDRNSGGYLSKDNFVPLDEEVLGLLYALRAVVELHKPILASFALGPKYDACSHCIESTNENDYKVDYPCPTIQAIEKELA